MKILIVLCWILFCFSNKNDKPARVDALFNQYNVGNSAGASVSIIQNGLFVYQKFFGHSEKRFEKKIDKETLFPIASISKQFTAMGILLLELEGKLNVHDSIYKYLPELRPLGNVTIHNLITHVSGYRDYYVLAALAHKGGYYTFSRDFAYELVKKQNQLMFEPNTNFVYSNTGYLLLEIIIERVTKMEFPDFMKKYIFDPLGMKDTSIIKDRTIPVKNLAYGYTQPEQRYAPYLMNNNAGTGGIHTSQNDFLLWDRNFYHNRLPGGNAIIRKMITPLAFKNGTSHFYCYGIGYLKMNGIDVLSHSGGWEGIATQMIRIPSMRLSTVVFGNIDDPALYSKAFQALQIYASGKLNDLEKNTPIFNDEVIKSEAMETPSRNLDRFNEQYLGFYHCEELGAVHHVEKQGNEIFVDIFGSGKFSFIFKPEKYHFWIRSSSFGSGYFVEENGKITGMVYKDILRAWNLKFTKLSSRPIC